MVSMGRMQRRDWWAILSTQVHVGETSKRTKTYVKLNVAGTSDRPITVVATQRSDDAVPTFVCLHCTSHACDHCLFVADHVVQHRAGIVDDVGVRRISTETPPHKQFYPWPGQHFGKRLFELPRSELQKLVRYYGAKKRRGSERYEELLAAAQHTLKMTEPDANDFETLSDALCDDADDTLPWEPKHTR